MTVSFLRGMYFRNTDPREREGSGWEHDSTELQKYFLVISHSINKASLIYILYYIHTYNL